MKYQTKNLARALGLVALSLTFLSNIVYASAELTRDNFLQAKASSYFATTISESSGHSVNSWRHIRTVSASGPQPFARMSPDTLYSTAVVDSEGGASIIVPDVGSRSVSVQFIDEDYETRKSLHLKGGNGLRVVTVPRSTKYSFVVVRMSVTNINDGGEIAHLNRFQDQLIIEASSHDAYKRLPGIEFKSLSKKLEVIQKELINEDSMHQTHTDLNGFSNLKGLTQKRFIAAYGWGGASPTERGYQYSIDYDTSTCRRIHLNDPTNSDDWSVTVYDENGYLFNKTAYQNSRTAKKNEDGSYTLYFGCDESNEHENTLSLQGLDTDKWNFLIRHYVSDSDKKGRVASSYSDILIEEYSRCEVSKMRKAAAWIVTSWIPMNTAMVWGYYKVKKVFCEVS